MSSFIRSAYAGLSFFTIYKPWQTQNKMEQIKAGLPAIIHNHRKEHKWKNYYLPLNL